MSYSSFIGPLRFGSSGGKIKNVYYHMMNNFVYRKTNNGGFLPVFTQNGNMSRFMTRTDVTRNLSSSNSGIFAVANKGGNAMKQHMAAQRIARVLKNRMNLATSPAKRQAFRNAARKVATKTAVASAIKNGTDNVLVNNFDLMMKIQSHMFESHTLNNFKKLLNNVRVNGSNENKLMAKNVAFFIYQTNLNNNLRVVN